MNKQSTNKSITLATAMVVVLFSGTTIAKDSVIFTDNNDDGVISAEEITAARDMRKAMMLIKYDTNGNGQLSRDERRTMKDVRYASMLLDFDSDGDGELSRQERRAAKQARWVAVESMLDVNGDGELTDKEMAGINQVRDARHERKKGRHSGRKHGPEKAKTNE